MWFYPDHAVPGGGVDTTTRPPGEDYQYLLCFDTATRNVFFALAENSRREGNGERFGAVAVA